MIPLAQIGRGDQTWEPMAGADRLLAQGESDGPRVRYRLGYEKRRKPLAWKLDGMKTEGCRASLPPTKLSLESGYPYMCCIHIRLWLIENASVEFLNRNQRVHYGIRPSDSPKQLRCDGEGEMMCAPCAGSTYRGPHENSRIY